MELKNKQKYNILLSILVLISIVERCFFGTPDLEDNFTTGFLNKQKKVERIRYKNNTLPYKIINLGN